MFEEIASGSFKETDRGAAIFLFPVLFFIPSRGYIVPVPEDVGRLKENVRKFHTIFTWAIVPVAVFFIVPVYEGKNLVTFLLVAFGVGLAVRWAYLQFFLRRLVRGYRRTAEKIGFMEAQRIQAGAYSMKTLKNLGLLLLCPLGLGVFALLRGDTALGVVLLAVFGLCGLQFMYLARIKRSSPARRLKERSPDRTNDG